MSDLLASSKALLSLDAENALVPHGLGGHGRKCLTWCVEEIERLRAEVDVLRRYGNKTCTLMADAAIETKARTGKYPFED